MDVRFPAVFDIQHATNSIIFANKNTVHNCEILALLLFSNLSNPKSEKQREESIHFYCK